MALRDVSELLWPAVAETLASLGLGSEDAAARKLAQRYAQVIDAAEDGKDQAWAVRWIGPELLRVLGALGATPADRARIRGLARTGGDNARPEVSWLDQQRQSRAARSTTRT